ncbi:DUF2868 domain-containing protein [Ectothiorhodospira mobilis]|uniref:DUF2868 domain-containing protein n=1 Tax=Ectothiorhodospira mobilis TaxID=195064 RepID=UPI001908EBA0|nr:DUF2868 domain-containing protein [Ectothiorhodospira mobilis]MBK1691926.1 hypothetical protein [Ectothiorhodospira mobilis]
MNRTIPRPALPRPAFADRLTAEAVRIHEDQTGRVLDEDAAWDAGRRSGGDLERHIIARATATRLGAEIRQAADGILAGARWMLVAALVVALLLGIGAAGAALGAPLPDRGGQVNIAWALGGLLGVQTLMLLAWAGTFLLPAGGGGLLGRAALHAAGTLGRRLLRRPAHILALRALLRLLGRRRLGLYTAGALTHALWTAFGIGALLACLWSLSVRQYDFLWGTTLLSEADFVSLVTALGGLPAALGIPVPDEALIRASRLGAPLAAGGRIQWSGFLLGCLLVYGVIPRLLLALLCTGMARRLAARLSLDITAPGYARLAPRLQEDHQRIGIIDPRPVEPPVPRQRRRSRPAPAQGAPLALVGYELEHAPDHWLQRVDDGRHLSLGQVDDRASRRDVLAALDALDPAPAAVVAVCSLARTPDRGAETFLSTLKARAGVPLWVLLDQAGTARERGIDPRARHAAWRDLALRAGAERCLPERAAETDLRGAGALPGALDSPEEPQP